VADLGKACGRHQTNVSRPDYCDCNGFAHLVSGSALGINELMKLLSLGESHTQIVQDLNET
jgi:hypothetical protein